MSSAPTATRIWQDAGWLAQAVDPNAGLIRLVEMTPQDYRQASFLDDRILKPGQNAHLLPWDEVQTGMPASVRTDARWIFHVGHVGSTLLSRILGELDNVLAVREPRSLRDLTFFPSDVREKFVPTLRALMSRAFDPGQSAIVKATSMVSEIADELVGENGRALFLFASPDIYLRTILAGDRSQSELQSLAPYYVGRAKAHGIPLTNAQQSPATTAALVWACEMVALEEATDNLSPSRVHWHDFEVMLEDPEAALGTIVSFFGLTVEEAQMHEILGGPLLKRYSKAIEYEFGPEARRKLLDEAAARHGASIKAALAMLNRAAEKAPLLARALQRSMPDF